MKAFLDYRRELNNDKLHMTIDTPGHITAVQRSFANMAHESMQPAYENSR